MYNTSTKKKKAKVISTSACDLHWPRAVLRVFVFTCKKMNRHFLDNTLLVAASGLLNPHGLERLCGAAILNFFYLLELYIILFIWSILWYLLTTSKLIPRCKKSNNNQNAATCFYIAAIPNTTVVMHEGFGEQSWGYKNQTTILLRCRLVMCGDAQVHKDRWGMVRPWLRKR